MDFTNKTAEELMELGFRRWSKESRLLLIPLSLYDQIPDGTELTDIFGVKVVKGVDYIDEDTRMGLLAYGFIVE